MGQQGRSGTDRQIQNAQIVILGEAVEVNEGYEHPKDKKLKWIDATVESSTSGLAVSYQGNTYRVTIDRRAPIINRTKVEHKLLKKARYIHVVGTSSETRPKTKSRSAAAKSSFKSKRVIILDARAAKAFPLLSDYESGALPSLDFSWSSLLTSGSPWVTMRPGQIERGPVRVATSGTGELLW